MRLYLSSYGVGNHPERLIELIGANKKVAVIINAADHKDRREGRLQDEIRDLAELGLEASEIDLRNYFGKQTELDAELKKYGAVWIRGGNVFVLNRAFKASGFDVIIKSMLARDEIVYSGYSAGVCLATPTLHGTEFVDDPSIIPAGYKQTEFSWDALNLIPYAVAVHYKSDHPESADVEKEIEYCEKNNIPYKTLRDGEVIFVDGEKEDLLK